jgi:hypothetical protein
MADTTSCDKRGEAIRRRMTAKIKQPEAVKRPDWLMHCFHGKEGKKVKKKNGDLRLHRWSIAEKSRSQSLETLYIISKTFLFLLIPVS